MHSDQQQNGSSPSSGQPLKSDSLRDSAMFAAAQAEIDKLNNIHAVEPVDWQRLSTLCEHVLNNEGKDLRVAIWLLCAWTKLRAMAGLCAGVHLLKEIVCLHWDAVTPPSSRLRARRNHAQWLIEWLDKTLVEPFEPLDRLAAERLISEWDAIDALWRMKDDQAPSFAKLRRRLEQIPCVEAQAPQQVTVQPAQEPEVADVPTGDLPALAASDVPLLDSGDAINTIDSSVEKVFSLLGPVQSHCMDQFPLLPLAYRLNRQAAWITLDELPPSQGQATRLPAPPLTLRDSVLRLQSSAKPLEVVRFCEARLSSYPFWLDLNRVSHAALVKAGASAAARALALEVQGLAARLPGVVELTFADGTPFADGPTRAWLESLAPSTPVMPAKDRIEACIDAARHMANEGRLNDGLAELQRCIAYTASARDRYRLRASQCVLVYRFDPHPDLCIALEGLLAQADELNLEQWEPELIKPLLQMMLEHSASLEWSRRLSRLDLDGFWRKRCGQRADCAND